MHRRKTSPLAFVSAGVLGFSVFFLANRYHWSILPTDDFGRGLWFGVCIGLEIVGLLLLVKSKARPKSIE